MILSQIGERYKYRITLQTNKVAWMLSWGEKGFDKG